MIFVIKCCLVLRYSLVQAEYEEEEEEEEGIILGPNVEMLTLVGPDNKLAQEFICVE